MQLYQLCVDWAPEAIDCCIQNTEASQSTGNREHGAGNKKEEMKYKLENNGQLRPESKEKKRDKYV